MTIVGRSRRAYLVMGLGVLLLIGAVLASTRTHGGSSSDQLGATVSIPAPTLDEPARTSPATAETAIFAGGCFWGVQGVYQHVKGVTQAVSGYAGGSSSTAHYEMVSTGLTGHAESVRITYDPAVITYGQLLRIFFSVVHDPTELNYQGPDSGSQYRSAIFPQNDAQKRIADAYVAQLGAANIFKAPIVTRTDPDHGFFPAENYHQNYLNSNPTDTYIAANDIPKLNALKRSFPSRYQDHPVLVPSAAAGL